MASAVLLRLCSGTKPFVTLTGQNLDEIVEFHTPKMYPRINLHDKMKTNSKAYDFIIYFLIYLQTHTLTHTLSQKDGKMCKRRILTKNSKMTFITNWNNFQ